MWIGAGFIANTVRDVVCPGAKITDFEKTIIAVIHSAVTVAILDLVRRLVFAVRHHLVCGVCRLESDSALWRCCSSGYGIRDTTRASHSDYVGYVGVKNRTSPTVWNEAMIIDARRQPGSK